MILNIKKKGVFIFLLVLFSLHFVFIFNVDKVIAQGSGDFGVSVTIEGPPSLVIISPENKTYITNESLRLKVSTNAVNTWYNLDNGNNITFTDETFFDTSEGGPYNLCFRK